MSQDQVNTSEEAAETGDTEDDIQVSASGDATGTDGDNTQASGADEDGNSGE